MNIDCVCYMSMRVLVRVSGGILWLWTIDKLFDKHSGIERLVWVFWYVMGA